MTSARIMRLRRALIGLLLALVGVMLFLGSPTPRDHSLPETWQPGGVAIEAQWAVLPPDKETRHYGAWTPIGDALAVTQFLRVEGTEGPPWRNRQVVLTAPDGTSRISSLIPGEQRASHNLAGRCWFPVDAPRAEQPPQLIGLDVTTLQEVTRVQVPWPDGWENLPDAEMNSACFVRTTDATLTFLANGWQTGAVQSARPFLYRYDPETERWEAPIKLDSRPRSNDYELTADHRLIAYTIFQTVPLATFEARTGQALPTPLPTHPPQLQPGMTLRPPATHRPSSNRPESTDHPPLTVVTAGGRVPVIGKAYHRPTTLPQWVLAARTSTWKWLLSPDDWEAYTRDRAWIGPTYAITIGGGRLRATPLGGDLTDTTTATRLRLGELWFTADLELYELDGTAALVSQVIVAPPPAVNEGRPILRLGLLTPAATEVDWRVWLPMPAPPAGTSVAFPELDIYATDTHWLLGYTDAPRDSSRAAAVRDRNWRAWTSIPIPEGITSPHGRWLCSGM